MQKIMVLTALVLLFAASGCGGSNTSATEALDGSDIVGAGLGNGKDTGSGKVPGGTNPSSPDNEPTPEPTPDDTSAPAPQSPGLLGFSSESTMVNEGDGTILLTILRTDGSDGEVSVEWGTIGQTATSDEDFVGVSWTTLTFAAGETSKMASVTVVDDNLAEGDETFQVVLQNPTGGATLGISAATVLIIDNDTYQGPGIIGFSSTNYTVNEGDGAVYITILRTDGSDGEASIEWGTQGKTATNGQDYIGVSWTPVSFAGGETSKVVSVTIIEDTLVEMDETFDVVMRNPTGGATLGLATTTVLIVDNDDAAEPVLEPEPAPAPTPTPAPAPNTLSYLPVFPGAQGFGTETVAGRGGKIIKVTNLSDSGTGSLRAAIEASGPRIVVFEVGGIIKTTKNLTIRNPFITIAGQTAPSPGIQIHGAGLTIVTNNVLVQHIGIRVGDDPNGPSPDNRDAIQIMGQPYYDTYNVVLDHISANWAIDENASTWYSPRDITISNSIISEGLNKSLHSKGPHSKGLLIGIGSKRISLVGSLLAHNVERMPRIQGNLSAVVLNNVFYNVGDSTFSSIGSADGSTLLSMVGNVFINGPNTPSNARAMQFRSELVSGSKIYYPDNQYSGTMMVNSAGFNPTVTSAPIWHESFSPRAGSTTEAWVLANTGTRPANRDAVDKRIVDEVKTRKGQIIDSPSQVGGFPTLASTTRAFNIPANPNADDDGNGYTNIEEILFQMAAQVEGR